MTSYLLLSVAHSSYGGNRRSISTNPPAPQSPQSVQHMFFFFGLFKKGKINVIKRNECQIASSFSVCEWISKINDKFQKINWFTYFFFTRTKRIKEKEIISINQSKSNGNIKQIMKNKFKSFIDFSFKFKRRI